MVLSFKVLSMLFNGIYALFMIGLTVYLIIKSQEPNVTSSRKKLFYLALIFGWLSLIGYVYFSLL